MNARADNRRYEVLVFVSLAVLAATLASVLVSAGIDPQVIA